MDCIGILIVLKNCEELENTMLVNESSILNKHILNYCTHNRIICKL